jgi:hypothetical protein
MRQLETEHEVDSIAFELLGPPRLSKLLFEAYLLKRTCKTLSAAIGGKPNEIAKDMTQEVSNDPRLRQHILSIGIPILLSDGQRLLRGPVNKSPDAEHGWVDLTPANVIQWQDRLQMLRTSIQEMLTGDTSSRLDRAYPSTVAWRDDDTFNVGEIVGWLFIHQERGQRGKE